eukprot:4928166-Karenia_brevis.AAC.1
MLWREIYKVFQKLGIVHHLDYDENWQGQLLADLQALSPFNADEIQNAVSPAAGSFNKYQLSTVGHVRLQAKETSSSSKDSELPLDILQKTPWADQAD